jgi:hypothetical protein
LSFLRALRAFVVNAFICFHANSEKILSITPQPSFNVPPGTNRRVAPYRAACEAAGLFPHDSQA